MMYPRIFLLRDFLRDDGTLFIHIDDNELGHALMLCDEVFGRNNRAYIVTFKQASATGHKAINPGCVNVTNNILIYAKNKNFWSPNKVFTKRGRDKRYAGWIENIYDHQASWRITTLITGFANSKQISEKDARARVKENPEELDSFVLKNANSVIRLAQPDYNNVGQDIKKGIDRSKENPLAILEVKRKGYSHVYLKGGQRILFYSDKIKVIDGTPISGEPLTTLWDDILSNNLHQEGGIAFPKGKKPEALVKRCLELAACQGSGDIVMDAFSGSGTTAAVAHKMGLRWICGEMEEHAKTHIAPRLTSVVQGQDGSGVTRELRWAGGGGFRFCALGESLFDAYGNINPSVTFPDLAAHVFYCETGSPIPRKAKESSPLIGAFQGRAIYLLHASECTGVADIEAGNVLTVQILESLPKPDPDFAGPRIIYGEGCTVSEDRLISEGITFKQIPYQIEGL